MKPIHYVGHFLRQKGAIRVNRITRQNAYPFFRYRSLDVLKDRSRNIIFAMWRLEACLRETCLVRFNDQHLS